MANKVKFGLKNVHYAKATIAADGTATFGTVKAWPGAVSITLDAQGGVQKFYADNIVYWQGVDNNGYSGSLESALVPEEFLTEIMGQSLQSTDKVIYEDADAKPSPFALMFEFDGDEKKIKHVLYNVLASRPSQNSNTKTDATTPVTETLNIEAASIYVAALQKNLVKARTTDETTAAVEAGWYSAPYVPAA